MTGTADNIFDRNYATDLLTKQQYIMYMEEASNLRMVNIRFCHIITSVLN